MHISDAAMDHTGAFEPPMTFNPTVRTNMYVPKNSLSSLEAGEYMLGGPSSSPCFSSGRQVWKRTTASAAPMNSKTVYAMHQPQPIPALDVSMPMATAGLKQPPEMCPAPYPPATTTKPIAKP